MIIKNTQKGFIVQGILAVVVLVLIAGGAYYLTVEKKQSGEQYEEVINDKAVTGDILGYFTTRYIPENEMFEGRTCNAFKVISGHKGIINWYSDGYNKEVEIPLNITILSNENKTLLKSSTKENPIKITLQTEKLLGKDTPSCFPTVKIIKIGENVVVNNKNSNSNNNLSDWKTYTDNKYHFELKYPANWIVDNDLGVQTSVYNPTRQGKADTDQPSERILISVISTNDCIKSDWAVGFALVNYKTMCLYSGTQTVEIKFVAFDEQSKKTEEDIISTFKFTSAPTTSNNQPSITVLSPNGGETWYQGDDNIIRFKILGAIPKTYRVVLYLDGKGEIAQVDPNVSTEFKWKSSSCFMGGDVCSVDEGKYKIEARLYDDITTCFRNCPSDKKQPNLVSNDKSDNYYNAAWKYSKPLPKN